MAARRNIVPTAEISIAATVVDPSLLLSASFFSFLSFFFFFSFLLRKRRNASDEKRRLLNAPSESANWARLISQATSQCRAIFNVKDV